MGAAGDMINAALYELLSDEQKAQYISVMNSVIEGVCVEAQAATKCGINGTHMSVKIDGHEEECDHEHSHCHDHDDHHHEHTDNHHHDHDHGHHSHDHHHAAMTDIEHIINAADVSDAVKTKAKKSSATTKKTRKK